MIAWYHLNSPVQRTGTLLLCNGSSRPRLLSFLRGGSEPTFGALQTGISTKHALSLVCRLRLLLLIPADISVIIVRYRGFIKGDLRRKALKKKQTVL